MIQLALFETTTTVSPDHKRSDAAKRLVGRLNKLRKSLPPSERVFDEYLARAVREIRTAGDLDEGKFAEIILDRIEHCAHTTAEIVDDTNLAESDVKSVVERLLGDGTLIRRERYTIGGSVNQWLLFSTRNRCGCD